ncbi:MAG: crosslink repair DNA glycosylase YcaQ family protein, partial [Pseudomonadota bacterium]
MTARLKIDNQTARALWLHSNGLLAQPGGPFDVMEIIRRLGFVQIDTIRNVTRAHHHILWSRNRNYREKLLWPLLRRRELFEHFTHDASLIPMEVLPYWQRQFKRLGERAASSDWYKTGLRREDVDAIKERIRLEGPLSTHAFETKAESREMWARPPHKKALDQMWYSGELATCHRENFVKFYDLGER